MCDVLIVGAGPAGSIAGLVAARAGARVRIVDRAAFPRDKLCGDTVNPGTLAMLARLGVAGEIESRGLRVDGMLLTGENGARVCGEYPRGFHGRAILRRDLDRTLLDAAVAAGCELEMSVTARRPLVREERGAPALAGVVVSSAAGESTLTAPVVVAADGRRSAITFGLGLAKHPLRPRRWAIGAYFEASGQQPATSNPVFGEMHVRRGGYIGVAPVPGGLVNVCLVKPAAGGDCEFRDPPALLLSELAGDPMLRDRFASILPIAPPVMLGPLAVDVADRDVDGLLLAGDAAGFIDPMTGDGLRFAIRGGELAGHAALRALEHGWPSAHAWLRAERATSFAGKWRFNRAVRALVSSPIAIDAAGLTARIAPSLFRGLVATAGDCHV